MDYQKTEWFNDQSFWEHFAPIMFDRARWEEVPIIADAITRLARLPLYENPPPKEIRILDQCCGFGRISLEMARRGFSVTGVDITKSYLDTARDDAAYESIPVELIEADVRSFVRDSFFDVVTNLYISFGYCADSAQDRLIVKNAFESLKPGGVFILETFGKEIAVRDFIEREWFTRAGFMVLTEYKPVQAWEQLENRWILVKDGKQIEKIFTQRLYAGSELRNLFREVGFKEIELYGDWNDSPYDQYARTLIITGQK